MAVSGMRYGHGLGLAQQATPVVKSVDLKKALKDEWNFGFMCGKDEADRNWLRSHEGKMESRALEISSQIAAMQGDVADLNRRLPFVPRSAPDNEAVRESSEITNLDESNPLSPDGVFRWIEGCWKLADPFADYDGPLRTPPPPLWLKDDPRWKQRTPNKDEGEPLWDLAEKVHEIELRKERK